MEQHQFPATRSGLTRKFNCGLDVYLTVSPKPDGEPGELFVRLGKQGSTVSGLMQAWAITVSAALQRGVPWSELREKYRGMKFAWFVTIHLTKMLYWVNLKRRRFCVMSLSLKQRPKSSVA